MTWFVQTKYHEIHINTIHTIIICQYKNPSEMLSIFTCLWSFVSMCIVLDLCISYIYWCNIWRHSAMHLFRLPHPCTQHGTYVIVCNRAQNAVHKVVKVVHWIVLTVHAGYREDITVNRTVCSIPWAKLHKHIWASCCDHVTVSFHSTLVKASHCKHILVNFMCCISHGFPYTDWVILWAHPWMLQALC